MQKKLNVYPSERFFCDKALHVCASKLCDIQDKSVAMRPLAAPPSSWRSSGLHILLARSKMQNYFKRRKRLSIIFLLGNVKIMKLSNKTLVAYFIKLSTPISNFNGLIVMQGPLALKRFRYSSVLAALHHKGLKRTCTSLDVAVHLVS